MISYSGVKTVVTGGAGFIGSHLTEKLLTSGAEVTILDNFLHGSKVEHLRGNKNLKVYEGDVRDAETISHILNGKDLVFHLAAIVGIEYTQNNPFDVLDVQIQGTTNVLKAAANNGVSRVVFASSSEVYGDSPKAMHEEGPVSPRSNYAIANLVSEKLCRAAQQKYGLEYSCLRYFNVYGPRQDERFVISRFVDWMLSRQPVQIYGDGNQTRDFNYVVDTVNMTLIAGLKPEAAYQVLNIGTGIGVSINEVASLIAKVLGMENTYRRTYVDYDGNRPRTTEVFTRCADTT